MRAKLHFPAVLLFLAPVQKTALQLHPSVEVETGFLAGAVGKGKWMKHEDAAKALKGAEKYRVHWIA